MTEKAPLFFTSARTFKFGYRNSVHSRLKKLLKKLRIGRAVRKNDIVPVKIHFGSYGSVRGIRPAYVEAVVNAVKMAGARPFVTDTVRIQGPEYLSIAKRNGYNEAAMGAPVLLADGIFGKDSVEVKAGRLLGSCTVASAIHDAASMVVLSHVKGHIQSGFGGAVKNLAMGGVTAAPRDGDWSKGRGKAHFLIGENPQWTGSPPCTLCGTCVEICPQDAVKIRRKKVIIDYDCWHCGRCISSCPEEALFVEKDEELFYEALAEQAVATLSTFKPDRVVYVNFMMDMQPECDCMEACDVPMIQDTGIVAGFDPVAVDKATLDIVAESPILKNSRADMLSKRYRGKDPLGSVHRKKSFRVLEHAEKLGIGTLKYEIEEIN